MLASLEPYAAIGVTILVVVVIALGQLAVAQLFGPKVRHGPVKDRPYESGMPLVMDTRRRFHIRFYLLAVLFLLFDVEIVFMWPWARVFHHAAATGASVPLADGTLAGRGFLAVGMGVFFVLLLFGLLYEWKRGALEWD